MVNPWPLRFVLLATALCGGCAAVPAGIKVASLVGDGISYAATGKSLTDHLLSGAMDRDCALLRVVEGESICRPDKTRGPGDTPAKKHSAPVTPPAPIAAAVPSKPPQPADYLVVGSFTSLQHARQWQVRYRRFRTALVQYRLAGATRFRVVVGPMAAGRLDAARRRLAIVGGNRPWRLALCPASLTVPPCASAPVTTVAQN